MAITRRSFLLTAAALGACTTMQTEPETVIVGARLIDPAGDAPPQQVNIVIRGKQIAAVGPDTPVPPSATIIAGESKYVVPGLWDMHAHIATQPPIGRAPEAYVGWGVVGLRDMGGDLAALQALRAEIAGGQVGPDLFVCGPTLNGQSFGAWHRVISTADEARAAVRELHASVDFFKTHRATPRDAFFALVDEARRFGKHVAGHVPLEVTWEEAADAGMVSFEHSQTIIENEMSAGADRPATIEEAIARLQGAGVDRVFRALAARGAFFDPTLIQYYESIDDRAEIADRRRQLYSVLATWAGRAPNSGVRLLAGTDVLERCGEMLHVELERLVEGGLTPRQALRAATTNPAELMHRADLGLEAGGAATLLILDADPDADIRNLRRQSGLFLRGRHFPAEELAALRAG